jgi:hypothetical protein
MQDEIDQPITVLNGMTALAISAAICHAASLLATASQLTGMMIPIATALSVALATLVPAALRPLTSSAEGLAAILMQARKCCMICHVAFQHAVPPCSDVACVDEGAYAASMHT